MKILMQKFGDLLISRPEGKEAYSSATAYLFSEATSEPIQLDFTGVKVLTPSWGDEFISPLVKQFGKNKIEFLHTENSSVKATLNFLQTDWDL